jgi:predicted small lipoprotein YifL
MSSLRSLLVLSAVAVALAGCGVRGPLEPPRALLLPIRMSQPQSTR